MATEPAENHDLAAAVARFAGRHVLVVGDFMLDSFVEGTVHRISPEAPIPVLHNQAERRALGGAGNVVANVLALGGSATAIGAVGNDRAGRELISLLAAGADSMIVDPSRITSQKTRFSAQHQQILRVDNEDIRPLASDLRTRLIASFSAALPAADVVVLSDYGKGVLLDGLAQELIGLARSAGKAVIVDPKGRDYSRYTGATAVTPNLAELAEATGRPASAEDEISAAAGELVAAHGLDMLVVTRGDKGLMVITSDTVSRVEASARELYDVSGAGDTVVAAFALAHAVGLSAPDCGRLANAAAGLAVEKPGTATVSAQELASALHGSAIAAAPSIADRLTAQRLVDQWKREGLRVGFTNGCFDLLHAGHVTLLQAARERCDRLVVGLNSDASVRRLKGERRPVSPEADRAVVLAALKSVDLVVSFPEDTPAALIEALAPDVLVKGADYAVEQVVGADFVAGRGGEVVLVELVSGRSTTEIIRRLTTTDPKNLQ